MQNSFKIIMYIIVGIVLINFFLTFFDNANLRGIRLNLEEARRTTDSALNEIKFSQDKLDSIMSDIVVFRAYINNIQKTVALADAEKRVKEEKDIQKVAELKSNISDLKDAIKNDSLPPIDEKQLQNN
jgi:polyhydroxyalkanoate synthesis regulator phasin